MNSQLLSLLKQTVWAIFATGVVLFAMVQIIELNADKNLLNNPCEACIARPEVVCFDMSRNWEPYPINFTNITSGPAEIDTTGKLTDLQNVSE